MIRRFQIEDLIVQDSSGVVFRALDTDTGKVVAVRRFFPFGVDGGGLNADEQTAYNIAVGRLAGLSHPALRSVICGGCDPVDGMPYIATEWVEGESLQPFVEHGPLPPESATELITQALEVCELLSHVLAEEAVWVETELQTIVVGNEQSGRRFTFWISPLKWLGAGDEPRGLESIVNLTEAIMGWKDQTVNDQAGRGLGGWLNWLRGAASSTSLHEARETLAASVGAEPPAPGKRLATRALQPATSVKPAKRIKRSSPKTLLFINLGLGLVVTGMGGWVWTRKHPDSALAQIILSKKDPPPDPEASIAFEAKTAEPGPNDPIASLPDSKPGLSESALRDRANERLAELSGKATKPKPKPAARPSTRAAAPSAVIPWTNHELLAQNDGKQVVVEGVVLEIAKSQSGKTVYLLFAAKADRNAARAAIEVPDTEAEAMAEKLKPFLGQKVHVAGTVRHQTIKGLSRPDVMMNDTSAVRLIP